jgi:hypothetical protein
MAVGGFSALPVAAIPHPRLPETGLDPTTILLLPTYRDLVGLGDNRDRQSRNYTDWLYQTSPPIEVVLERDGDRLLLVQRTERGDRQLRRQGQVRSAFQVIGLPSRVFPGLTGVQAIPPETVLGVGKR